jgi:hypothetical protein
MNKWVVYCSKETYDKFIDEEIREWIRKTKKNKIYYFKNKK